MLRVRPVARAVCSGVSSVWVRHSVVNNILSYRAFDTARCSGAGWNPPYAWQTYAGRKKFKLGSAHHVGKTNTQCTTPSISVSRCQGVIQTSYPPFSVKKVQ
jgi:hypothetical protein